MKDWFSGTREQAAQLFDCHWNTLSKYRKEGKLIEGIHYIKLNKKCFYNLDLLVHLKSVTFQANHPEHRKAIQEFQRQRKQLIRAT